MRKIIFVFILVLVSMVAFGQCPDGVNNPDVFLYSQADVDDFSVYSNCTSIGDLEISGDDIVSLDSLYFLTQLNGSLLISWNDKLKTLAGLQNMVINTGYIEIVANDSLTDISQLHGIAPGTLMEILRVENNKSLLSLDGLQNIEGVSNPWGFGFQIINNDNLITLEGLEGLKVLNANHEDPNINTPIINIVVKDNDALVSLEGLGTLVHPFDMRIENNPSLFNLQGLKQDFLTNLYLINNNNLLNLQGLKTGTSITNFYIEGNDGLESTDGLDSLFLVDWLDIHDNESLLEVSSLPDNMISITIRDNNSLLTINGFTNFTAENIKRIRIYGSESLMSLNPLQSITNLTSLGISTSNVLTNLNGLENLIYVQEVLNIGGLPNLTDISALHQLAAAGTIQIINNTSLTSLTDLGQSTTQFENVIITYNQNLSVCDAESICNFLQNFSPDENTVEIINNASNCNSRAEVEAACMIIGTTELIKDSPFIQITPNPAFSHFEIKFLNKNQGKLEDIRIFDGLGRLVYVEKMNAFSRRIDVFDWTRGLYVVLVNGRFVEKFLVQGE